MLLKAAEVLGINVDSKSYFSGMPAAGGHPGSFSIPRVGMGGGGSTYMFLGGVSNHTTHIHVHNTHHSRVIKKSSKVDRYRNCGRHMVARSTALRQEDVMEEGPGPPGRLGKAQLCH